MTNGEKIMQAFPDLQIDMGELEVYMWTTTHDAIDIPLDWWNEEYKEPNHIADADKMIEPTADNDSAVDCIVDVLGSYTDLDIPYKREIAENILTKLPSVTPQPCEDAVSRQEVLYLIADYDLSMGQVVKGIHALPSVTSQEPKWIPTSERLPEKNMACLVATGRFNFTQIAVYSDLMGIIDHQIFYQGDVGHDNFKNITQYVKAWMPLPTSYREVEE